MIRCSLSHHVNERSEKEQTILILDYFTYHVCMLYNQWGSFVQVLFALELTYVYYPLVGKAE